MSEIKGLSHININVSNLDNSLAFYVGKLGFENIYQWEMWGHRGAYVTYKGLMLELHESPEWDHQFDDGRPDHIDFECDGIEGVMEDLKAKGVVFDAEEITDSKDFWPNGSKWIMFRGPDNERLELHETM